MAYSAANLTLQFDGGAGFAKRYIYTTTDAFATVAASGYFTPQDAYTPAIGDIIEVRYVDAVAVGSRTSASGRTFLQVATNNGTTVTTQSAEASGGSAVIDHTAATLTVTRALHHNKTVLLDATPVVVTLPQATGTGSKFRFIVQTLATATQTKIQVANATDVMEGYFLLLSTASDNEQGFATTATSDTISLNGTTTGGLVGDTVEVEDIKTGIFHVRVVGKATGTVATPFAAAV